MPLARKRQAPEPADSDDEVPQPSAARRQRTRSSSAAGDDSEDGNSGAPSSLDAMVKKMVRLALASEYSRLPIRRTDISAKVLGEQGTRQFKVVFEQAQKELKTRFGMEMVELPAREKTTISQRRAAQKTDKPSSGNKSWILTTTLPQSYQTSAILPPTKAPSVGTESTYTGLYSFIIALITLNGGSLAEPKLDRYLARMNAESHTPIDRTDKLLLRMIREGYLVRTREMDGGEEQIEFLVGPRGKVEVGTNGVAGLVREVYGRGEGTPKASGRVPGYGDGDEDVLGGEMTQMEEEEREAFEGRLRRSLGIRERPGQTQEAGSSGQRGRGGGEEVEADADADARRREGPRRSRRSAPATQHDSESSGEEDSATDSD
ncbi:hypothetical protein N7533_002675 [Penicillium manginii]|uniref:uncharacterized protein n=1 Tax=Penicillium manginii TaxID=203109 RepID=UPI0025480EBF|nr:uncharacterized protein N7533_002675 [Penicillium manginii]KAJ5763994.1 hypothetical protein N7533_002675 [Penicillium manginii]